MIHSLNNIGDYVAVIQSDQLARVTAHHVDFYKHQSPRHSYRKIS